VAGLLWSAVCRSVAFKTGFLSHPNPLVAQHTAPVPYLGGVAVFAAATTAIAAGQIMPLSLLGVAPVPAGWFWLGGLGFLLLGLTDDLSPFRPMPKLALQFALTFAVLLLTTATPRTAVELFLLATQVLWIVLIVNAVNLTDVCDGLMTGLAVIALVTIAITKPDHATWALLLACSAASVLLFNFPPARIYQGDAGSHLLGFTLGAMTLPDISLASSQLGPVALTFGPLLLGVFLFEVAFITKMRHNKGLPWWKGSPDHFALRMQAAGVSKTRTVVLAWSVAVLCAVAAWWTQQGRSAAWLLVWWSLAGAGCVAAWRWLRDLEPRRAGTPAAPQPLTTESRPKTCSTERGRQSDAG